VLDEDGYGARDDAASFHNLLDLVSDFAGALALGADLELLVVNIDRHRPDASAERRVRNDPQF
jgi:hypothetical protein